MIFVLNGISYLFCLLGDEDIDAETVEISDTSNESSQDGDNRLAGFPSFLAGNKNFNS